MFELWLENKQKRGRGWRIYLKKRTIENRLDSEKGLEAGRIEQTTTTDNSNINSNNNINMGKAISSFVQT